MLDPRLRLARPPAPPPTTFIGRGIEIDTALQLVRDPSVRLVTLTGAGGIGKTRLALEIAKRSSGHFGGQVSWVALAPVRAPELVLPAVAAAVDVQDSGREDVLDRLTEALATERLLLVLDNAEHVLGAASDVSALLRACPRITVLATSRAPLRISGERILVVPPLPVPDGAANAVPVALDEIESVRLFVDRARSVSPSFNLGPQTAPLVSNICQRLDGLPLAIELAAARIYHISVRTMNERLAYRLPLLTGGAADLPERQQTLHRSISWSYDLLTSGEQRIFERLAVFSGGFTVDAVEAMSEDPSTALDQLTRLVDESLVHYRDDTPAGPRYSMLETIHEYAVEHLMQSGEEAPARARHASFYSKLAQQAAAELAKGDGDRWAARLEMERSNLRQVFDWLAETRQWSDYLALASALGEFWDTQGHLSEGRAYLERALLETAESEVPEHDRAHAATRLALLLVRQGAFVEARSWLDSALQFWSDGREPGQLAFTLCVLGGVAEYSGDDAEAQALYARGLALYREAGEPSGTATVLNNLADTAYRLGDLSRAAALAGEAVTIAQGAGLDVIRATALFTVAEVAIARAEWAEALAALHEGMRVSHSAGYRLGIADAFAGFACIAAATRVAAQAAQLLGAGDAILDGIGARRVPHHAVRSRALALARSALDETAFAAAWERGRASSLDASLEEASRVKVVPALDVPPPLSARELDVLRLLVTGKSDRAIGEVLFIGTRTVESHVASIYAKLGVRSRAAATAVALGAGLVEAPPTPASSEH